MDGVGLLRSKFVVGVVFTSRFCRYAAVTFGSILAVSGSSLEETAVSTCQEVLQEGAARVVCDLGQPSCSRCLRYGINCVGSGEKKYKFKNATITESTPLARSARPRAQVVQNTSPERPLGNELTSTAGAFISILSISDRQFAVQGFGPFLTDVPRRLGRSPILNASAKAFSSAVTAIYSKQTIVEALKDYGTALTCVRNAFIADPSLTTQVETLCGVYLLLLSQNFIRGHNDDCLIHIQGLLYILNNQSLENRNDPFTSQMIDLASIVLITETVIDPRVKIKSWQSEMSKTSYYGPLNDYSVVDIRSTNLTVANLIDLPAQLEEPENHLVQLRSSYELMKLEAEKLVPSVIQLNAACEASKDAQYYKAYVICESSVCVLHCLMAVLRRTLQIFHPMDFGLAQDAKHASKQVLAAATRAWSFRPLGTTYMPKTLCLQWATTDDPDIKSRLENMIDQYRQDFRGDSWTKLAMFFEHRFEKLRRRAQSRMRHHAWRDTTSSGSLNAESEFAAEAVLLEVPLPLNTTNCT
ncbi:hypothetical protein E4U43_008425 [Claviceps pusilla]|uniref:Zn(2)-C6 fungal-type domain-containing protein n=1 Tax=Claviceps pusilla TaxID=123648 RepID=A0A9P7T0T5_9HYPO|nr:hypothetical protein E4U43_008425 [Claviceps pusilla]